MQFGPVITSKANERVKALRASFAGKASRPGDLVGLEGEHLLAEALRSGMTFETVFVRKGSEEVLDRRELYDLKNGQKAGHTVLLSEEAFDSAVETETPQGIAALLEIPAEKTAQGEAVDLVLILEAVRDPGNLGTLLRSAEAFGVSLVMMTPDCVNPWNPKVMRSSAGSVFRIPMLRTRLSEMRARLTAEGVHLFAAVVSGTNTVSSVQADLSAKSAVMIGNEGSGLSSEAIALADTLVTIPCKTESLNAAVAGATLLYEAMRQRVVAGESGGKP